MFESWNNSLYYAGRLQYEGINTAIIEFNEAIAEKYNFLQKGFQAMASIQDKKRFKVNKSNLLNSCKRSLIFQFIFTHNIINILSAQEMKSLETKEAKGFRFVVADDLRGAPTLKSEGQRKNIFTILRHFQRIKEIRGPGQILRYAILQAELKTKLEPILKCFDQSNFSL